MVHSRGFLHGHRAIIGSYSVQGFPGVGAGMLLGLLVILYAFLPAISSLKTLEDPAPIDQ